MRLPNPHTHMSVEIHIDNMYMEMICKLNEYTTFAKATALTITRLIMYEQHHSPKFHSPFLHYSAPCLCLNFFQHLQEAFSQIPQTLHRSISYNCNKIQCRNCPQVPFH